MKAYKIWGLVDPDLAPIDLTTSPVYLDYKTGLAARLHPVVDITKGEVQMVDYYRNSDGVTFNDLVLRVTITWIRSNDPRKKLLKRVELRQWVVEGSTDDENPEFGPDEKTTEKYYTTNQAEKADVTRRRNIVADLTAQAEAFDALTYTQTMFRALDDELNSYEKTGDTKLIEKIGSYSGAWLDNQVPGFPDGVTLRLAIMDQLTI